jgi:hypothetical protein
MPYINVPLTQVVSLDSGFVLTVVNALASGGSGVANSQIFTTPYKPGEGDFNLELVAVPNGGVTTVTVDIEVSSDGGTTWQKKHVGVALIAASVSTAAVETGIQPALLYRINPTTVTGGTSVTINATAN